MAIPGMSGHEAGVHCLDAVELGPQAETIFHIDHVAVLRQPVDQRGGKLIVF